MNNDIIDLGWRRFYAQVFVALLAISGGAVANIILLEDRSDMGSFAIAASFVLLPLVASMMLSRVPYRTDEFERRLRNWSMTQSGVWALLFGVIGRLLTEQLSSGPSPITVYVLPGMFFLYHALYSQYLRYKIATGGRNAFSDG